MGVFPAPAQRSAVGRPALLGHHLGQKLGVPGYQGTNAQPAHTCSYCATRQSAREGKPLRRELELLGGTAGHIPRRVATTRDTAEETSRALRGVRTLLHA